MYGRISGLSSHDYHAGPGISSSQLKKAASEIVDYYFPKPYTSAAMDLGTAVHSAILEPDDFERRYIVRPKMDRRTKEGKAAYDDFLATYGARIDAGEIIEIADDVREQACRIRDAVLNHPTAANLFVDGVAEDSFFWNDPETGMLCKCRPDWLRNDGIEVSLKTARNASRREFNRDCVKYGYHLSTAFYRDGLDACGITTQPTVFVVVETDDPRPERVAVYTMCDYYIERGREMYRQGLDAIHRTNSEPGAWKGYPVEIQTLECPTWA
jgi:hypothetical protein